MDIFEIKSVEAVIRMDGKQYKFADPKFLDKVRIQKLYRDLISKRESMSEDEYLTAMFDINKKQIMQYLPELESTTLDEIGEYKFNALLNKTLDLTRNSLGAVVEHVEKK